MDKPSPVVEEIARRIGEGQKVVKGGKYSRIGGARFETKHIPLARAWLSKLKEDKRQKLKEVILEPGPIDEKRLAMMKRLGY